MKNTLKQKLVTGILWFGGLVSLATFSGCEGTQSAYEKKFNSLSPEEQVKWKQAEYDLCSKMSLGQTQQQQQTQEACNQLALQNYKNEQQAKQNTIYVQQPQPDWGSQLLLGVLNGNGLTSNVATYEWMKRN